MNIKDLDGMLAVLEHDLKPADIVTRGHVRRLVIELGLTRGDYRLEDHAEVKDTLYRMHMSEPVYRWHARQAIDFLLELRAKMSD